MRYVNGHRVRDRLINHMTMTEDKLGWTGKHYRLLYRVFIRWISVFVANEVPFHQSRAGANASIRGAGDVLQQRQANNCRWR